METVRRHGQAVGVLFYRTKFRSGLREIIVDDLLLHDQDASVANQLLDQLLRRVRADYVVAHAAEGSRQSDLLRAVRFRRVPGKRIALLARTLTEPAAANLYDPGGWSLCFGDLEGL